MSGRPQHLRVLPVCRPSNAWPCVVPLLFVFPWVCLLYVLLSLVFKACFSSDCIQVSFTFNPGQEHSSHEVEAAKEAPKALRIMPAANNAASSAGTRPARSDFDELIGLRPEIIATCTRSATKHCQMGKDINFLGSARATSPPTQTLPRINTDLHGSENCQSPKLPKIAGIESRPVMVICRYFAFSSGFCCGSLTPSNRLNLDFLAISAILAIT
jgi:hypothetical protein